MQPGKSIAGFAVESEFEVQRGVGAVRGEGFGAGVDCEEGGDEGGEDLVVEDPGFLLVEGYVVVGCAEMDCWGLRSVVICELFEGG